MYPQNGSPLSMDWQLRRQNEPQILHAISILRHSKHGLIQIGLVFISLHILVDYLQGGIILNEYEDWARLNIMICGMTSGALSASIGFLFMMQLRGIGMNLTTVETYVEGI